MRAMQQQLTPSKLQGRPVQRCTHNARARPVALAASSRRVVATGIPTSPTHGDINVRLDMRTPGGAQKANLDITVGPTQLVEIAFNSSTYELNVVIDKGLLTDQDVRELAKALEKNDLYAVVRKLRKLLNKLNVEKLITFNIIVAMIAKRDSTVFNKDARTPWARFQAALHENLQALGGMKLDSIIGELRKNGEGPLLQSLQDAVQPTKLDDAALVEAWLAARLVPLLGSDPSAAFNYEVLLDKVKATSPTLASDVVIRTACADVPSSNLVENALYVVTSDQGQKSYGRDKPFGMEELQELLMTLWRLAPGGEAKAAKLAHKLKEMRRVDLLKEIIKAIAEADLSAAALKRLLAQ